jgi:hypothetical protein
LRGRNERKRVEHEVQFTFGDRTPFSTAVASDFHLMGVGNRSSFSKEVFSD